MKKTALITGATSGLGYEFVQLLAKEQYNLIVVARNEEKLLSIKSEFPLLNVTTIPMDLSKPGSVRKMVEEIQEKGI